MIKEAISFVEKFESDQTQQRTKEDWKGKKFVIINTKEEHGKLCYDGVTLLQNDEQIKLWIDDNKHYTPFLSDLNRYIKPIINMKSIGSNSSFLSMAFFSFRLTEKNISGFEDKLDKLDFNDEKLNEGIDISNIRSVLKEFYNTNKDKSGDYKDYILLIETNPIQLKNWINYTNEFIKERYAGAPVKKSG
ncbi:hypothetical protein HZB02_03195 [Candidatus Woesearchaeota archaeon]|nr:hypothetical protein [Candidatus Woesearchaeota archaeon]